MNKYTFFYFFALLALAYAQSSGTKTIPADLQQGSSEQPLTKVPPSSSGSTTKAPPSEFLASQKANRASKTVPPEILTAANQAKSVPTGTGSTGSTGASGVGAGIAANSTPTPATVQGNNTNSLIDSSATKVTGTLLAAVVAAVMALY